VHKGRIQAPNPLVSATAAIEVVDISAMLTVNPHWHPGRPRRHLHFESRQVSGMHDRRTPFAQQPPNVTVEPDAVARRLVQGQAFHVLSLYAVTKVGGFRQCEHEMSVFLGRHVVDEIHDPVFDATSVEPVEHVRYQRPALHSCAWHPANKERPHVAMPILSS
jgi:hypothetical protein